MITLGGIELSDDLRLHGLRVVPVGVDAQRSDDGVLQVIVSDMDGGRALELTGFYTAAQVDMVMDLARMKEPVTLVHPRGTFQVYVTGCDLVDWIDYVQPDPDDYEEGTIQLLEVG